MSPDEGRPQLVLDDLKNTENQLPRIQRIAKKRRAGEDAALLRGVRRHAPVDAAHRRGRGPDEVNADIGSSNRAAREEGPEEAAAQHDLGSPVNENTPARASPSRGSSPTKPTAGPHVHLAAEATRAGGAGGRGRRRVAAGKAAAAATLSRGRQGRRTAALAAPGGAAADGAATPALAAFLAVSAPAPASAVVAAPGAPAATRGDLQFRPARAALAPTIGAGRRRWRPGAGEEAAAEAAMFARLALERDAAMPGDMPKFTTFEAAPVRGPRGRALRSLAKKSGGAGARGAAATTRRAFDLELDGARLGRLTLRLFADKTPRTAENFRLLCRDAGYSTATWKKTAPYEGTAFHRVVPGFVAQGGDFTRGDGTGGESAYAGTPGADALGNGADTNGSQFFVTLAACRHLDGKHVVFGEVVGGLDLLDKFGGQRRRRSAASSSPPAASSTRGRARRARGKAPSGYPPMATKAPSKLPFGAAPAAKAPSGYPPIAKAPSGYPPMATKAPSKLPFGAPAPAAKAPSGYPPMATKAPSKLPFGAPAPAQGAVRYPPMATKAPSKLPFGAPAPAGKAPSGYPPMATKAPSKLPFGAPAPAPAAGAAPPTTPNFKTQSPNQNKRYSSDSEEPPSACAKAADPPAAPAPATGFSFGTPSAPGGSFSFAKPTVPASPVAASPVAASPVAAAPAPAAPAAAAALSRPPATPLEAEKARGVTLESFARFYVNLSTGDEDDDDDLEEELAEERENAREAFEGLASGAESLPASQFQPLMEALGTTYCEEEHRRTLKRLAVGGVVEKGAFIECAGGFSFGAPTAEGTSPAPAISFVRAGTLPLDRFEDLLDGLGEGFYGDELEVQRSRVDPTGSGQVTRESFARFYVNLSTGDEDDDDDLEEELAEERENAREAFEGLSSGAESLPASQFQPLMEALGTTYCEEEHRRTLKRLAVGGVVEKGAFIEWYAQWVCGDGEDEDEEDDAAGRDGRGRESRGGGGGGGDPGSAAASGSVGSGGFSFGGGGFGVGAAPAAAAAEGGFSRRPGGAGGAGGAGRAGGRRL
ncbi:hypothetical protein JL720_14183 [Aureococcus anophagefferens]|nr:hypothetical protein JL720_14183 [Aureococcus anophagefferens]